MTDFNNQDIQDIQLGDVYPVVELFLQEIDDDGRTYVSHIVAPASAQRQALVFANDNTLWLCSHLLDYFKQPPLIFYVQIKPLYAT